MERPTISIYENKGADQLRSNCEADQRHCFRYMDSTSPLLSKSKISGLLPSSVTVQAGLCRTWSESKLMVFSSTGSYCCWSPYYQFPLTLLSYTKHYHFSYVPLADIYIC